MEVLLLFTIFLNVHLAVGWIENILEPGRAPKPPEEPPNSLIPPEQKFSPIFRPPQRYPLTNNRASPQRIWSSHSGENFDNYWQTNPSSSSSLQNKSQNCLTTGIASSGLTIVSILAIVTILFKILPYLFTNDSDQSFHLADFIRSETKKFLPSSMQVIPDMIFPDNTWTPKRPYDRPDYYSSANQGRYSPYRRIENDEDYQ